MKKDIAPADFDRMLEWLNPDRERAGAKLEQIRRRLVEILASRGCPEPEYWADETTDRVASKVREVAEGYEGDPAYYFYGVAKKVFLECMKKRLPTVSADSIPPAPPAPEPDEDEEREHECLERCLGRLPAEDRELILGYYSGDGSEKIAGRNEAARRLGIGLNALRIRAYRIRIALKGCVEDCLGRGRPEEA